MSPRSNGWIDGTGVPVGRPHDIRSANLLSPSRNSRRTTRKPDGTDVRWVSIHQQELQVPNQATDFITEDSAITESCDLRDCPLWGTGRHNGLFDVTFIDVTFGKSRFLNYVGSLLGMV